MFYAEKGGEREGETGEGGEEEGRVVKEEEGNEEEDEEEEALCGEMRSVAEYCP